MTSCPRRLELGQKPDDEANDLKDDHCTYCGSMSGDAFIVAVRAGKKIGPTDKNYKAYVEGNKKFYFQHLSEHQRNEFLSLLQHKLVNIGYPGYFYKLPFFIVMGS